MNPLPDHRPGQQRAAVRTDARLDAATGQKVEDLARRFHQPRGAVLCHIMQWSLSRKETLPLHQAESYGPVCHLYLYVPFELHEQVEKAAAATRLKTAPWLHAMVRQMTIADFPASWQEATPSERSHDSLTYTERFMLRLNNTSSLKLQELVDRFDVPKANIIRHLITQAKPDDFPKSWQMQAKERGTHSPRR